MSCFEIIEKLYETSDLTDTEFQTLLETDISDTELFELANKRRLEIYDNKVYIRGLIEFTNYCKNNCFYCGIRCGNKNAVRYRLTKDDIMLCCEEGYRLGFRTFVLQGGEDVYYTDEMVCDIVSSIHGKFPDCAITLSIGEYQKKAIRLFLMPVQTDIYFAMKQRTLHITTCFIPQI